MSSTFLGLSIASSGLTAANAGINVTADNLSNRSTVGYSRQVVRQQAAKAIRVFSRYGAVGAGVTITGIDQIRDSYYDHKYWKNQGSLGEHSLKNYYMSQIEELYFSEVKSETSGFTAYYSKFTASLETLYTNPADISKRNAAIQSAQTIASYFNDTATSLNTYQDDANLQISVMVERINSAAQNIAALNKQIQTLELNGAVANELRDQRANVVDELSKYVGVTVTEKLTDTGSSSYTVRICNNTLVDGHIYNTLHIEARDGEELRHEEDNDGLYDIIWNNGMNFSTYNESLTGMIKGYIDIRDGNNQEITQHPVKDAIGLEYKGVPYYKVQTNLFVKEYAREFNKIQMRGQNFNEESTSRIPFFSISNMKTEDVQKQADLLYNLYKGLIEVEDPDGKVTKKTDIEIQNADGSVTKWSKGSVDGYENVDTWIEERALEFAKEQHPTLSEADLKETVDGKPKLQKKYINEYLYGINYDNVLEYAKKQHPDKSEEELLNTIKASINTPNNDNQIYVDEYRYEYLHSADYQQKAVAYAIANNNAYNTKESCYENGKVKEDVIKAYKNATRNSSEMAGYMVMVDFIADQMTAGNICVNEQVMLDNNKMATTGYLYDGVDSQDLIKEMVKLADKKFIIGGTAEEFMESLVSVSSIDSKSEETLEANYTNISHTIENQRFSISGVDEDEETINLVKYQQAYNLAAKCISVMSEIYDKLINETAV